MTIIKLGKDGKLVLKKNPDELAIPLSPEDTETPHAHEMTLHVDVEQNRRTKAIVNLFLLGMALMVLTAGIIGGVYLYRYMHHKNNMTKITVQYKNPEPMPTPVASHMAGSGYRPTPDGMYFMMEEVVDVELDQDVEKIEVPKFDECRSSVVIHDFHMNVTVIVDNEDKECFIMDLDQRMTLPKDLNQMIRRYYSGYYMPKVEVIRNNYVVIQPAIRDLRFTGAIISAECLGFDSYRLEKRMMPNPILEIRFSYKTYGYTDMKTLVKDFIFK